ncbi:Sialic acid transporter NanT [Alphaproteobacteria bacterium SO-S41]|nr:Sialic acid transporter NanT [Alphaproteobacteria bacterium SO-S41]
MTDATAELRQPTAKELRLVVTAASLGTVFEWYDFFVYGTLAALLGSLFFPAGNDAAAFLLSLATFGAGFMVRPLGALFFGMLGDIVGRKYTFLVTITLMGVATAGIGFLPTFHDIGIAAAVMLLILRLLQGLAIGGEYGGAATYVAEHAPQKRRGYFTSYIQATATIGLFLSLAVVAICRTSMSEEAFKDWGWRIPFLLSLVLLAVSIYIRMKLHESPIFQAMKEGGHGSKKPIRDSFGNWANLKVVLIAFFGACIGQGVLFYTANFYAMLYMQNVLAVGYLDAYLLLFAALVIGMALVIFFGWLSDRVGRKWLMMTACLLGALTLQPVFHILARAVNPALMNANEAHPVTLQANPADCSIVIFDAPKTGCQKVRALLSKAGVQFTSIDTADNLLLLTIPGVDPAKTGDDEEGMADGPGDSVFTIEGGDVPEKEIRTHLTAAGYPAKADAALMNWPLAIAALTWLVLLAAMIYGPIAAFLVELFPTRIRYTSLSLPYNISNGLIGGFQPFVSFAIITATGDIFAGLWYPIAITTICFLFGAFLLPETSHRSLHDDDGKPA